MRRKEFDMWQDEEIEQFLNEMSFGYLGTVGADGWPRVTPLNFAYANEVFYFHGSKVGEKMKHLQHESKVSFTVAKEYALIPSYFSDPEMACPATAFFKSVMVKGTAELIEDLHEKSEAFTAFMQKLQPEGGYDPITPDDPRYIPRLQGVAMIKIVPEEMTAKFKFGQNLKEGPFNQVVDGLTKRNHTRDEETVQHMQKYCPFHAE
ncbi:pyridoxamine 5'-phosphate oxidase family protein [Paenibacillus sediminis]|uniref:Nitroimidazol reductase NimA-like FMN-containing flavoprotein (Pyridoxamine 5'-phosphate oxidase superfamily) n=1 Tax=Paenibacillus sediminis TaxID=664909 RepID=A0ABS4H5S8_9BACL|nr:pyridoxamine 5'-phosphate oxidase family protein [Paenibacillus sediminis]MBP1937888.1 nitroimidazol reductase NimA-like FMN-containing flavoprotein (pyridoxamine 5'-phosphate oxidase superfamily) [Paenibacillus sediminis]